MCSAAEHSFWPPCCGRAEVSAVNSNAPWRRYATLSPDHTIVAQETLLARYMTMEYILNYTENKF